MHGTVPGGVGEPPDSLHRKPGLRPPAGRHGVEPGLGDGIRLRAGGVLDEEPAGLELYVLTVGVGEELLPHPTRPGEGPEPQLLTRHLLVPGPVPEAVVLIVIVAAEEVVQLAHHVVRLVATEVVVAVEGEVSALIIQRPGLLLARMVEIGVPRHRHLQVVLGEGRCRHPVVVGLLEGSRVVPENVGLEVGPVRRKSDLHPPMGPGRQIHAPHPTAHASVGVLPQEVVHRGGGGRRVANDAEVEFDAARGPWTPEGDVPELHHLVAIDELVSGLLHDCAPDLSPHLRQHEHLDVVVLQTDHLPLPGLGGGRVSLEGVIGIEARIPGQDRDGIRLRERVGLEGPDLFGDAGALGARRRGSQREKEGHQE